MPATAHLAFHPTTSTFLMLVAIVVRIGANEQMIRTHAGRVVAVVAHAQASLNSFIMSQLPRQPMRTILPVAKVQCSVAVIKSLAGPLPAPISTIHLSPERLP